MRAPGGNQVGNRLSESGAIPLILPVTGRSLPVGRQSGWPFHRDKGDVIMKNVLLMALMGMAVSSGPAVAGDTTCYVGQYSILCCDKAGNCWIVPI